MIIEKEASTTSISFYPTSTNAKVLNRFDLSTLSEQGDVGRYHHNSSLAIIKSPSTVIFNRILGQLEDGEWKGVMNKLITVRIPTKFKHKYTNKICTVAGLLHT